ncbi:MAG TPA: S53 family peptidase [Armatimonadota bacterium]|jgi:subtilase family serine protease
MWYRSLLFSLAVLLACTALLLTGCGGSGDPAGQAPVPSGWEARPPVHIQQVGPAALSGYTPQQIRHAYGFDTLPGTGSGEVIAIVDAYGSSTIQSDLNTFCTQFGLPTTTVQIAYPQGGKRRSNAGWALETSLDVEWAHAMAPGATILLVVANDASFNSLLTCVDYAAARAGQVSMSWGGNEFAGETLYDFHFNKTGVTFTASSGDSGGGAQWPAVSPYVVSVGGTSLSLDSAGNRLSETAWSGSNGGPSAYEDQPAYQTASQSTGHRTMPDVSYNANPATGFPVYCSASGKGSRAWVQVGGTSAGAPQWAALLARANAARGSRLSSADAALYALGSPTSLGTYFLDITSGTNRSYSCTTGYDLVTGLGSPRAGALVPAL